MQLTLVTLTAVQLLALSQAFGQIRQLDAESARGIAGQLREVDFEGLSAYQFSGSPGEPVLPNPLRFEGLTVSHPFGLGVGFCSTPTCEPDPDNFQGGNIAAFLYPNATLSFGWSPSVVILDVQGMGSNPFTLTVRDGWGERETVNERGAPFDVRWVSLTSASGIDTIQVEEVGGSGGPMVVSRVLFSDVPEPSVMALSSVGALFFLYQCLARGRRRREVPSGQFTDALSPR